MKRLNPAKYHQRLELTRGMDRDGTILEIYGGKGNLTRAVYKGKARRHIIVDKHPARRKLAKQLPNADLVIQDEYAGRWLEEELPELKIENLTLVDLDPYGSPGKDIQRFFANHTIRQPTRIAVTDGYALRLGLLKSSPAEARQEVYARYLTEDFGDGTRENQIRLLDNLMREMGRRHDLTVDQVNSSHGEAKTVYAGYLVRPRR